MKKVAHELLKTRTCNKMASNNFVIVVCFSLVNVSSGQEAPITVVLGVTEIVSVNYIFSSILVGKNSPINIPIYQEVEAHLSYNGTGLTCNIDGKNWNHSSNSFLEANLLFDNNTTVILAFLTNPRCDENHCKPKLFVQCSYIENNKVISKSATIDIKGITKVRNLTAFFSPNNSTIQISWLRPLPLILSSSIIMYRMTVINEHGDVVFNVSTEATSYSLNNITECLTIVSITACQDGNTSTVTEKVSVGYCNSTSSESSSSTSIMMMSTISNRDSTTTGNSVLPSGTISTVSSPPSIIPTPSNSTLFVSSGTVLTSSTMSITNTSITSNSVSTMSVLPSTNTGQYSDFLTLVSVTATTTTNIPPFTSGLSLYWLIPLVVPVCSVALLLVCGILVIIFSRQQITICLDKTTQDTLPSQTERAEETLNERSIQMTGEDERNMISSCLAQTNQDTSSMETV